MVDPNYYLCGRCKKYFKAKNEYKYCYPCLKHYRANYYFSECAKCNKQFRQKVETKYKNCYDCNVKK
jgi:hypothetical protein